MTSIPAFSKFRGLAHNCGTQNEPAANNDSWQGWQDPPAWPLGTMTEGCHPQHALSGSSNMLRTYGMSLPRGDSHSPQQEGKAMPGQLQPPKFCWLPWPPLWGSAKPESRPPPEGAEKEKAGNKASIRDPFCLRQAWVAS